MRDYTVCQRGLFYLFIFYCLKTGFLTLFAENKSQRAHGCAGVYFPSATGGQFQIRAYFFLKEFNDNFDFNYYYYIIYYNILYIIYILYYIIYQYIIYYIYIY